MPAHKIPFEIRFWSKVEKTDTCWNWTGSLAGGRYGKFSCRVEGGGTKTYLAHRVAFEILSGEILLPGMHLDHKCHNIICVNPGHLRQVTRSQNNQHRKQANQTSQTGVLGVSPKKYGKPYQAQAKINSQSVSAGSFNTIEEANEAVIALRNRLFTHNDHDPKPNRRRKQ
jgi:hypothetical protein